MREPRTEPSAAERLEGALGLLLPHLPGAALRLLAGRPPLRADGQTLDPVVHAVLALQARRRRPPMTAGSPAEARARLRRQVLAARGRPTPVGAVREVEAGGAAGPLPARLYTPEGAGAPTPLLVYYHGGGYMLCDLDTHDEACRLLCHHAGHRVLSVAYRLAPEHPFPAPLDDALAAFRWAQAHAAELGTDAAWVGVGGDSAGANLAAVVAQRTRQDRPPAAQLLIYPPTDRLTPRPSHALFDRGLLLSVAERDAFSRAYTGGDPRRDEDPAVSPLRAADLEGLPPALVVVAGFDILRDEAEAYAAALRRAGNRCEVQREPSLPHGFLQLTGVAPAAREALVRTADRWAALAAPFEGAR